MSKKGHICKKTFNGDDGYMEISNKTLALLLVAAIVVSIGGTLISLNNVNQGITGHVTSNATGTTSVNVGAVTTLRFDISSVDFGAGSVNTSGGFNNCTMWINGTTTITQTGCTGFNTTNINGAFVIENAGTTYLNVTLNCSKNASTFIGGTSPAFQFVISNNNTGSCVSGINYTGWTDAAISPVNICTNLTPSKPNSTMLIGVQVRIPQDSLTGSQSAIFTAQGTNIN